MNILHGLNEKQTEAVKHKDGPILVIAGPGTGKTKVITHRIAYLIREHRIKPYNILAITFTNKAAEEMRERVNNEIGEPHGSDIKVSTFHAFCVKVLRKHAQQIGLSENFAIFDQEIQDEILEEAARELHLNSRIYPSWRLRNIISDAKCKLKNITDDLEIDPDIIAEIDDPDAAENIKRTISAYQHKLTEYNALDFDDLLVKTVEIFEQESEVQNDYHKNISYILVDEYHDVNSVQYALLKRISASPNNNLMVVADADQSIYSWRGSNPQYIEHFIDDFSPEIVELDEHYRCSEKILRAAEEVIGRNTERQKQHTLKTHKDVGRNIYHYTFSTATEEAQNIIKIIRNLIMHRGVSYRDIAIFYRTHKLADVLAEELLKQQIKFQRIRPTNSLDEEISKGIFSYLRFIQWKLPQDLENAINFPEKRIDDLTWVRLKWLAIRKKITLAELLKNIDAYPEDVGPFTRRNIQEFWGRLEALSEEIKAEKIDKIAQKLFATLDIFRSPYRQKELVTIERQPEMQNVSLIQDVLYSALNRDEPITITANYGVDEYCAASIIHQTFKTYLNKNAEIHLLPKDTDRSKPTLSENGINLLIGDFGELDETSADSRIIIIGTTAAEGISTLQLQSDGIRSIDAFRLSQRLLSRFESPNMADMVIYDLETTGVDTRYANIVEIAAQRLNTVGDGIERYYTLVKPPGGHIPRETTRIHRIDEETVKDCPSIEMVLPEFCRFIQDRILIGHNVANYDNPILARVLQEHLKRGLPNPHYDTLVTARRLFPRQRRGIQALAEKFGIGYERLHSAPDDVEVNRKIFKELIRIDTQKQQLKSLTEFLPWVGLGILAKTSDIDEAEISPEIEAYLNAAKRYVKVNHNVFPDDVPFEQTEKEQVTEFFNLLRESDVPVDKEDSDWIEHKSRFLNVVLNFEKAGYGHRLIDFLDYQKLLTSFDELDNKTEQLTLMTLHAAKGTEFPVVFIIGMENGNFPIGRSSLTLEELEEERRLFYVGMTRAQNQLYLSSAVYRFNDRGQVTSMFIHEMPSNYMEKWSSPTHM